MQIVVSVVEGCAQLRLRRRLNRLNARIRRVQRVGRVQLREKAIAPASDVGHADENVRWKLTFNGQVPLRGVGPIVSVERAIEWVLAIVKVCRQILSNGRRMESPRAAEDVSRRETDTQ